MGSILSEANPELVDGSHVTLRVTSSSGWTEDAGALALRPSAGDLWLPEGPHLPSCLSGKRSGASRLWTTRA